MTNKPKYAEVILPLPLDKVFTYIIPDSMQNQIVVGARVLVSFGSRKYYTGIVSNLLESYEDSGVNLKEISEILDSNPIVNNIQLDFWNWISKYYMSSIGDVYKAALPSGLKIESETIVRFNENFESEINLTSNEQKIVDILQQDKKLSITDLNKKLNFKNTFPIIKNLLEKEIVLVSEDLKSTYKAKTITFIALHPRLSNDIEINETLNKLARSKKQKEVLLSYLELSPNFEKIERRILMQKSNATSQIINELIKKEILTSFDEEVDRLQYTGKTTYSKKFSEAQAIAYNKIKENFKTKQVTLLHGVTSSGKTEIYIKLIQDTIDAGKQVLFLLPEIALTTQITQRLREAFGDKLGVYHSKFSDNERVEIWKNLLYKHQYQVILGARSSIFLPFDNLGLIIVDEEHESSFKQFDPAPRYHARNAAIMLSYMHQGKVLLGSATPSIESYYNCQKGKYGLVELFQRYQDISLPEIRVVDLMKARSRNEVKGMFSIDLRKAIKDTLDNQEQVILFQNRRGFAPQIECDNCGWVPKCTDCDVSMTYHKFFKQLTCHYCGHTYTMPSKCPKCGNEKLKTRGYGTEKVAEEVANFFPNARIVRMDADTTKSKFAYEQIINSFEDKKVDILIGTQMISKGLDFDNVRVVGIINADNMLSYPDFRANERSYQLMAQVSGRAGRKGKQGLVILQTYDPTQQTITQVKENDYKAMYQYEMEERKLFKYPPLYRMISVFVRHKDMTIANNAARELANGLRAIFGERILGPDNPVVSRIQTLFIKKIELKIEEKISYEKTKALLASEILKIRNNESYKSVIISTDVDPV